MDDYEAGGTQEETGSDVGAGSSAESWEEPSGGPEDFSGETESSGPEESSGETEPGGPDPEEPPSEETGGVGGDEDRVQDLIDAIGDLNETITGAVTQEPEQLPAGEVGGGAGGDIGGGIVVEETGGTVDLSPVVQVLERNEELLKHTNELLEEQGEILNTQHNDLLQLQANVNFVFLAVAALIGVVLGAAVGKVFHDLWRA